LYYIIRNIGISSIIITIIVL